eukprot:5098712-Amphidinium_carterae.1
MKNAGITPKNTQKLRKCYDVSGIAGIFSRGFSAGGPLRDQISLLSGAHQSLLCNLCETAVPVAVVTFWLKKKRHSLVLGEVET